MTPGQSNLGLAISLSRTERERQLTVLVAPHVFEQASLGIQRCGIPLHCMHARAEKGRKKEAGVNADAPWWQQDPSQGEAQRDVRVTCILCPLSLMMRCYDAKIRGEQRNYSKQTAWRKDKRLRDDLGGSASCRFAEALVGGTVSPGRG